MGCKAGQCNIISNPQGIYILIPSLGGWPFKDKKAPSWGKTDPCLVAIYILQITTDLKHYST